MATKKCGNIYFPKHFMAVRPFLTRKCFQELFGLEGSKNSLKKLKFRQLHNLKISDRLLRSKSFFKKIFLVLYAAYVYPFFGSEPVITEEIRVSWTSTDVRRY